jgi:hypothetical protein
VSFIQTQFGTALQVIKSVSQFDKLVADRDRKALFVFNITSTDNESISLVSRVTFRLRHFPVNFALIFDAALHLPTVSHLTTDRRSMHLLSSLTDANLTNFLKSYSIPFLAPFPGEIAQHAELEGIPLCIFVFPLNDTQTYAQVFPIARAVHSLAPVVHTCCDYDPEFCRYVGLRGDVAVVFLNKSKNLFWVSDLKPTQPEWVKQILRGELKGSGPGDGPFSDILYFFYEMRGRGGMAYWRLYFPVVLIVFYALIHIVRCMISRRGHVKTHAD